jgi:hypothetical protein
MYIPIAYVSLLLYVFRLAHLILTWRVVAHLPKRGGDVMVLAHICTNEFIVCVADLFVSLYAFWDHMTLLSCDA